MDPECPPPGYDGMSSTVGLLQQSRNRTGWPLGNITVDWPYCTVNSHTTYWTSDDQDRTQPTKAMLERIRLRQDLENFDKQLEKITISKQKTWIERLRLHTKIIFQHMCKVRPGQTILMPVAKRFNPAICSGEGCKLHGGLQCFCATYQHGRKRLKVINFKVMLLDDLDHAAHYRRKCRVHICDACYCVVFSEHGKSWIVDCKGSRIRRFSEGEAWMDIV